LKIKAENDKNARINWTKNPNDPKNEQAFEQLSVCIISKPIQLCTSYSVDGIGSEQELNYQRFHLHSHRKKLGLPAARYQLMPGPNFKARERDSSFPNYYRAT
jgi:hypothetical protein